jgi:hypothetical protein
MLAVISPSKTLNFGVTVPPTHTTPRLLSQSEKLIETLQALPKEEISQLMKLSHKLTELNYERYQQFHTPFTPDNAKQAICVFKGNVYDGINVDSYLAKDFESAQQNIRILSGLYGLLRPLDLIQPYRLEMGTRLTNTRGKNLYEFWDKQITTVLNSDLAATNSDILVNLASNEYWKAVRPKDLNARVITISFKEHKDGAYKMLMVYVKKARGLMASYIAKNNLKKAEDIKSFDCEGYHFNPSLSSKDEWVFTR